MIKEDTPMKRIKEKIPALIAMLFSLVSWGFYLSAHLVSTYGTRTEENELLPFTLYLVSTAAATTPPISLYAFE